MWRDLFNRAASTEGSAIKQIAPHRQLSLGAIFFSQTISVASGFNFKPGFTSISLPPQQQRNPQSQQHQSDSINRKSRLPLSKM
jgi:hypothetical protein